MPKSRRRESLDLDAAHRVGFLIAGTLALVLAAGLWRVVRSLQ